MQSKDATSASENNDETTISFLPPKKRKASIAEEAINSAISATSENNSDVTITVSSGGRKPIPVKSSHIVTAESVQAEEVPTIPLGSLQTLSTLEPEVSVRSTASTRSVRLPAPLVVQPSEYRRSLGEWLQVWWEGMRPGYLSLALMPVLLGALFAWMQTLSTSTPLGHFHLSGFIATVVAVVAIQIGANLINDYYDYIKGIDTGNPLGPGGLIQQGLIRPTRVFNFGLVFLVLGALIGAVAALAGGLYVYLLGAVGILCAFFYSATSRALSSIALGEFVCFCVFGPLLTLGTYMAQVGGTGNLPILFSVFLYSLPLGLLATAVVHVNNMRDAESDMQAKARKRTLATLLGLRWSRILYVLLVLGAYALVIALGIPPGAPHLVLLTLWTLPTFLIAITGVLRADMPASLHLAMSETLKLQRYFALFLIVGLLLTALIAFLPHFPSRIIPI